MTRRECFLSDQRMSLAVAQVARGGPDQLRDLMRMLKFTAIDLDDRTGVPKQNLCGGFHDARLSGPCGPLKQEAPYRAPRRVQAGAENLEQVDHRLHRFLLPDDLRAQRLTKLRRLAT